MAVLLSFTFFFFEPEGFICSLKVVSPDYLIQMLEHTWRPMHEQELVSHHFKALFEKQREWES